MKTYAVVSKHLLLPFVKTRGSLGTDTQIDPPALLLLSTYSEQKYVSTCSETGAFSKLDSNSSDVTKAVYTYISYYLGMWYILRWEFLKTHTCLPFFFPSTLPPFIFRQKSIRQAQEPYEDSGQHLIPRGRMSGE